MVVKKKTVSEEEAEEIMKEEPTNHSTHIRMKQYDKSCFWCQAHGYV
jgi:hypothetical protein